MCGPSLPGPARLTPSVTVYTTWRQMEIKEAAVSVTMPTPLHAATWKSIIRWAQRSEKDHLHLPTSTAKTPHKEKNTA